MAIRRPRLVRDWRRSWRWLTMQLSTLGATGASAWMMLDDTQRQAVLKLLHLEDAGALAAITFGAIAIGRLVDQSKPGA